MRPTQFKLATAFYYVTIVAIVTALLSPAIRAASSEGNTGWFIFLACQTTLFLLVAWHTIVRRARVLKKAGRPIRQTKVALNSPADWPHHISTFSRVLPLLILQAVALSPWIVHIALILNTWALIIQMVSLGLAAEAIVAMHLGVNQRDVELYENGYVYHGFYFQPWSDLLKVAPAIHSTNRIFATVALDTFDGCKVQTIKVSAKSRDEIVERMRETKRKFDHAKPESKRETKPKSGRVLQFRAA